MMHMRQEERRVSPTTATKLMTNFRKNSVPMELNNSERYKSDDSSSQAAEGACSVHYPNNQSRG